MERPAGRVRAAAASAGSTRTSCARSAIPRKALPADPDALAEYDCIILGDVAPDQLPLDDRARLETIRRRTAAARWSCSRARRRCRRCYLTDTPPDDPIRKLLPVEAVRSVVAPAGFSVSLTSEGRLAAFLADGARNRGQRGPLGGAAEAVAGASSAGRKRARRRSPRLARPKKLRACPRSPSRTPRRGRKTAA